MEYFKLMSGMVLVVVFFWILSKNSKRTSFLHAVIRVDTILGIVVGLYLVLTSVNSLLFQ